MPRESVVFRQFWEPLDPCEAARLSLTEAVHAVEPLHSGVYGESAGEAAGSGGGSVLVGQRAE